MKILVTGGAGFIASHITDRYIDLGHDVVVVDDLSKGFKKNINPKAVFYETDIRDLEAIQKIFKDEQPDAVNHHAALAEVAASMKDPTSTLEVNLIGTVNLLLAGGEAGIKKFIFASTGGAIYGNPKTLPADENAPALPLSPYGLSKLLAEEAIRSYARTRGFPYLILRYANIYGPRQNPKGEAGVVAIFRDLMKNGNEPTIFGDGSKTRDYVYVADVAEANILALEKGTNETINIGCGKETSDQEIFDTIAKALNYKEEPNYAPFREGEVMHIALGAKKAESVLGWEAKMDIKTGIAQTVSGGQ